LFKIQLNLFFDRQADNSRLPDGIFFKPNIQNWVYFGWPSRIFDSHLVHRMAIWYILWLFGMFFPFWYAVPGKIWQHWTTDNILIAV
jgi:hypothetical protein